MTKGADHCCICGRKFADGEAVVPVMKFIINENRGNFFASQATKFLHLSHIRQA